MAKGGLIDDEIVSFMRGGVVTFLGSCDALGTPEVTRVTGIGRAGPDRLRLLISSAASVTLANMANRSRVAVLVTEMTTYRSVQWKGTVVQADRPLTPGDIVLSDHNFEAFRTACATVGVDPAIAWRMWPVESVPVVVEVDEMFDQTPGPVAGQTVEMRTDT